MGDVMDHVRTAPSAVRREDELKAPLATVGASGAEGAASRIPSLDGFRALSIAMVLLHHATRTGSFPPQLKGVFKYAINGNLGVRFFFVISGFLITTLLLKEEGRKGAVSLRLFYERRAARILPVYWAYILTVLVYSVLGGGIIPTRPYLEALTFSTSWFHTHQWIFEHTWSLSVEEAFYLLWPLLFKCLGNRGRVTLALSVLVAGPVLRGWLYHLMGEEYFGLYSLGILGNIDPIMWGCLLALLHQSHPAQLGRAFQHFPILGHGLFFVSMMALIELNLHHAFHAFVTVPFTVSFSCLGVCYLLYYHCYVSKGLGYRLLNLPIVVRLGILSYSLYLWQQIFLFPAVEHRFWWQQFPANLAGAVIVAATSYYLLERPFLRLRERLRRRSLESPRGAVLIRETYHKNNELEFSIGLLVKEDGAIQDVLPESAASKAGLATAMKLVAVNGHRWTPERLRAAINATASGQPLELLIENAEFFKTCRLDYAPREKYPALARDQSKPDLLTQVLKAPTVISNQ